MIIHNFNLVRAYICPGKANTVPMIYPYAALSQAIPRQGFQLVAGWDFELIQPRYRVQLIQFTCCDLPKGCRAGLSSFFGIQAVEDIFRTLIFEVLDHNSMITRL